MTSPWLTATFPSPRRSGRAGGRRSRAGRIQVDRAAVLQFVRQLLLRLSRELGHVGQVHPGPLPDGHGEGLLGGVHMGDGPTVLDGALGEDVGLVELTAASLFRTKILIKSRFWRRNGNGKIQTVKG